ncbi:N-acetylmuramoyl-L-alanine amidase [uncultured Croceitalea sp.]|uniref:N-acetylmuramoyl-L-alanine amidase family protein n=1 Tax=uncultured Croceitalea sp. TaxID=1798908 RepID=UPI003306926B
MIKRRFVFTISFVFFFAFSSFIKNNTELPLKDKFIVVLDAGHGGHDPGNLGNGYLEKDIALSIVLEVGKLLEKNPDIKVIYTRDDDTFVDLYKRGEIANQSNADLFVSVHCDSHNSEAYGAGTFVLGLHANKQNFEVAKKENSVIYLEDNYEQKYAEYDINSPESVIGLTIMQEEFLDQSIELAKLLQKNFTVKLKRKDRKVKQAGFIVLHQTFMPSVLIETGFLTNKTEGSYLNSGKGQKEMGIAIANAILSYKDGVEANLNDFQVSPDTSKTIKEEVVVAPEKEVAETATKNVEPKTVPKKEEPKTVSEVQKEPNINKEKEIRTNGNTSIIFKVQLMATSKVIPLDGSNFRGLNTLSKEPVKNLFRYMYGNTGSYQKAKLLKSNADAKGYTTSYIVAYKDGKRIALKEALKSVSQP